MQVATGKSMLLSLPQAQNITKPSHTSTSPDHASPSQGRPYAMMFVMSAFLSMRFMMPAMTLPGPTS
jgi:hypothetical protein